MTSATAPLSDAAARDRILTDLDTTLMVEAGAGSGKTTSLVGRMLAHVRRGTPVEQIAAVTFTRKAAAELRERFEGALEQEIRDAAGSDAERHARAVAAREHLDRAFLGTIHAFCGRLLREHPLEAGIDPGFEEIAEEEWPEIRRRFWSRWLERRRHDDDPGLAELVRLGIDPRDLADGFAAVVQYPDVEFRAPERPCPDARPCRRRLEALMQRARDIMPAQVPEADRDKLQRTLRRLEFLRRTTDWSSTGVFCAAIARLSRSGCAVVQKQWADKLLARELGVDFAAFVDGDAAALLAGWREHRYRPVMAFLQAASREFERERLATGRLGFEDLLLGAARLLRENPAARRGLGERYRWLLVDEFQDTDPVQAEVCLLLASDPAEGSDWRQVTPRPGSLFVVGDPKQSIYRFRRADIQIYELVKQRIRACGDVLGLSQNFRSADSIREFVNDHFAGVFPAEATAEQAGFVRMVTAAPGEPSEGVRRCLVTPDAKNQDRIVAEDAERVASWIAARIGQGTAAPGDFLVLTHLRKHLEAYARALASRNVPATLAGAGLPKELELGELLVVLRVLADPSNPVLVTAALEGMPFGCSHADLWTAREGGLDFSIAHAPAETDSAAGQALQQLYEWWIVSQRSPADVLLDRILDDTGMLVHAASLPLGEGRAGTLLHLVERVRLAAAHEAGTLADAIAVIESALAAASSDAALRPGRSDAVRVMNLHKAKGLEARIVVLAAPVAMTEHPARVHVSRSGDAGATGGLMILQGDDIIAQPPGWNAMQAAEAALLQAERQRLRYVAVTRAKRELVVTQLDFPAARGPAPDKSIWSPLAPTLTSRDVLAMPLSAPADREALRTGAGDLASQADAARSAREAAARPGYSVETVTRATKADGEAAAVYDLDGAGAGRVAGAGLGKAWGRVVHRAVEALGRGRRDDSLRRFVRALVREEQRLGGAELDAATARVLRLLDEIRSSADWPLLAEGGAFELPVMLREREGDRERITEGVADALLRTPAGWRVLDWKTDAGGDQTWARRREAYQRQVDRYAEILATLTGESADGSLVRLGAAGDAA